MNRLRILEQRAARGLCGVTKLNDGSWWVGCGRGVGDCTGPFVSKREALLVAVRWAMPHKKLKMYINGEFVGYV